VRRHFNLKSTFLLWRHGRSVTEHQRLQAAAERGHGLGEWPAQD